MKTPTTQIKVNLGCGPIFKEGWINVDGSQALRAMSKPGPAGRIEWQVLHAMRSYSNGQALIPEMGRPVQPTGAGLTEAGKPVLFNTG